MKRSGKKSVILFLLCLALAGCASRQPRDISAPSEIAERGTESISPESVPVETSLPTPAAAPTATPVATPTATPEPTSEPVDTSFDFTICFAGDINLDENWDTTRFLDTQPGGIYD
ncbi:MAG: hypothetical protein K2H12_04050, partial [Acetatifactor sp.]|nr:hypothetical protein [Acetatifactor sp.]